MKVTVTKSFNWFPDGNHLRVVEVGEVLEGEGARVALELKSGEEIKPTIAIAPVDEDKTPIVTTPRVEEKSVEEVPLNKAVKPTRNKSR
jgi:hypothetical protein